MKIATPGLNGTNKKMRFAVDPDNSGWPGGCQSCPLIDTGVSGTAAVGTKYWLEFWVEYEAGFQWGCGANCSMKTIDINGVGTNERILLTVWGSANDTPAFSKGHTFWSMYPNYQPGAPTPAGRRTRRPRSSRMSPTSLCRRGRPTISSSK